MEKKNRDIKSFVLRSRMSNAQRMAVERYWGLYGLELEHGLLDPVEIFGREADIILEIGFGMGESLVSMAAQHPENDYIGVEVHRPGIGAICNRIAAAKISNIKIFQADVLLVLAQCIPQNSLAVINIFFPDPWPKRSHHKRRLINAEFVAAIYPALKTGGKIHIATDWKDYALQIMQTFTNHDGFINIAGHGRFLEEQRSRPLTKFEKRGQKLGHEIWDMIFVKA